jgi:hypothetical protein
MARWLPARHLFEKRGSRRHCFFDKRPPLDYNIILCDYRLAPLFYFHRYILYESAAVVLFRGVPIIIIRRLFTVNVFLKTIAKNAVPTLNSCRC